MAGHRKRKKSAKHGKLNRSARHRRIDRRGRIIGAVIACGVLTGATFGYWYYDKVANGLSTSDALGGAPAAPEGDQNILLMGLDSRKDLNGNPLPKSILEQLHAGASSNVGGYNANTLILLHTSSGGSRATGISIPRDNLVDVPGFGKQKIKEAYGLAKAREEERLVAQGVTDRAELEKSGREAGRRAEIETVRKFLNVPIHHFAEINLAGFYDLANALGGIEVCLKRATKDEYSGADFRAGRQVLNARQSLAFVRQRHQLANGDLDRTRRQQAFLLSAMRKLETSGTLDKIERGYTLLDAAKRDIVIDNRWNLMDFVDRMKGLAGGKMDFHTLKIKGYGTYRNQSVNIVDPDSIRREVQGILRPAPHPTSSMLHQPRSDGKSEGRKSLGGTGIPCVY